MSGRTGISWCDTTWNPIRGCSRVSEGCRNCYAEEMAGRIVRMGKGKPTPYDGLVRVVRRKGPLDEDGAELDITEARWTGQVAFDAVKLAEPLRWRKPKRIFINSMSDLFHEQLTNEQIAAVFGAMAACPQHTFLVLTKRAKRMREWFEWLESTGDVNGTLHVEAGSHISYAIGNDDAQDEDDDPAIVAGHRILDAQWPLPNVHLGVSVEDQDAVDERIPDLLATPAAVRWLSCEPLLGQVDVSRWLVRWCCGLMSGGVGCGCGRHILNPSRVDWVVAGCESGRNARPCNVEWLRSLRGQCKEAGVAFWLKQAQQHDGEYTIHERRPLPKIYGRIGELIPVIAVGDGSKRKTGGIIELPYLDGVQHAELPKGDAS